MRTASRGRVRGGCGGAVVVVPDPQNELGRHVDGQGARWNVLADDGPGAGVGTVTHANRRDEHVVRAGAAMAADGGVHLVDAVVVDEDAQIGAGSKVPHLTYVGDATIGE